MQKQEKQQEQYPNQLNMGFIADQSKQPISDLSSHNSQDRSISTISKAQTPRSSQWSFDMDNQFSNLQEWAVDGDRIDKPKRRGQVIYQQEELSDDMEKMRKGMTKKIINGKLKPQPIQPSPYSLRSRRKIVDENSSNSDNQLRQIVQQISNGPYPSFSSK